MVSVYEGAFSIELGVGPLLWIYDLDDQERWGNVIHLPGDELELSPELADELTRLGRWFDESFDWTGSSGWSPWSQEECDRFSQAFFDGFRRLDDELGRPPPPPSGAFCGLTSGRGIRGRSCCPDPGGAAARRPLAYTQVVPEAVVELVVDPAVDGPRWRHPARFVRLRPDLQTADLTPTTATTLAAATTTVPGTASGPAAAPRPRRTGGPRAGGARRVS